MKRKPAEPKEEGCALWVVTFGDAMSLLVTFFVMLVSFASFEESSLMQMVGAMRGGLRAAPVPGATSVSKAPRNNALDAATKLTRHPALDEQPDPEAGDSTKDELSRLYPVDTSDYFLQLLDNGVSLMIYTSAAFEPGTARIRNQDSEVWRVAAGLMSMVRSEIRVMATLPESTVVRSDSYSTAWGLGIEQSLAVKRFMSLRFGAPSSQLSTSVQVVTTMERGTAVEGMVEIRYIGMGESEFREIPKYILKGSWRDSEPKTSRTENSSGQGS